MNNTNPRSLDELSLAWLNAQAALKKRPGADSLPVTEDSQPRITRFKAEPVGETAGFLGDIGRIRLSWDPDGAGVESIIAKFPTLRASNLETGKGLLAYEREMRFYQNFSAECPLHPPAFYGGSDVSGEGDYLLLMEDLESFRFVSQLDVLSAQDASACLAGLARMHAYYWEKPELDVADSLYQFSDWADIYAPIIATGWPLFQKDFGDVIPAEMFPMYEPGNAAAGAIFRYFSESRPKTLLHGDARIENFCFHRNTGAARAYDWQLAAAGPGIYDVILLLGKEESLKRLKEVV